MSKRDVIDPDLRLRFAWRTAATLPDDPLGQQPPPAVAPEAAEAPARDEDESEMGEGSAELCEELARRVARVWEMTPRARQAAATHGMLARLEASWIGFMGMTKHPVEVMRLWRLGVRHARVLGKGGRRILWSMPIVVDEPEAVDFLVEVVESDEDELVTLLEKTDVLDLVARRGPALCARLVRVIERGETCAARERAVRWLVRADRRAAAPPLRRALREPLVRLRSCALRALMEMSPAALTVDDVQWLLDDAVEHPLPRGTAKDARSARKEYAAALLEAVKACPPPEGWRALTAILEGYDTAMDILRDGLDRGWALAALAAGWPERAVAEIDEVLARSMPHRRADAVAAAALLPEAMARPRLLEAAALPCHEAAERAKDRWFARFGEACPVSPLAGVPVELLDAAPSDALLARLTVVRGASAEAAAKILGAALAEAPSREALVLLLYSLRDIGAAHEKAGLDGFGDVHFVARLVRGQQVWAGALLRRFGAPAFDGILAMAAREAQAGGGGDWLDALASLARKGALDEAQRARLRDLAAGLLGDGTTKVAGKACGVFEAVGAPAPAIERLWSLALAPSPRDEDGDRSGGGVTARHALGASKGAPEVEARFFREAKAALERRDWEMLGDLVATGGLYGIEGVLAVGMRVLGMVDREPGALAIAETCARALERAGRIGQKWIAAALEHPSSPLFDAVAEVVRVDAKPAVVRALRRALDDRARDGRAAAAAATALVLTDALPVDDPRLDGILERAPERARAKLVDVLFDAGAELASLRRHCEGMLLSQDERIARGMFVTLERFGGGTEKWTLMESVMARGPTGPVRESIDHYLGAPSEAEMYWRDPGDDDEPV
jgi:hypothetical protein